MTEAHKLARLLTEKNLVYEMKVYPGQGHGFTGADAADARQRALAFLQRHLRPSVTGQASGRAS